MAELQSHTGNRQQQLVATERARGRQVALQSRRRDPPEFHLNACVDVQRVRQRHPELVAAIAPGAAGVRHSIHEPLVAVDFGMTVSGKHGRTAGMVRVGVGVDDRAHRRAKQTSNAVLMARAAGGSVEVSTMIDPPLPWIKITLLAE
jgi:hypothetical protein